MLKNTIKVYVLYDVSVYRRCSNDHKKNRNRRCRKILNMLKQLDNETKNMMLEPGERKTYIEEMETRIKNIKASNSLMLVAEEEQNIFGFLSADRGFANRIKHSSYIVIGILKSYRGKKVGTKLF